MNVVPSHRMFEDQISLRLEGPLEAPEILLAHRAGVAVFDGSEKIHAQRGRSSRVDEELHHHMKRLRRDLEGQLDQFEGMDGRISARALVRRRCMPDVEGYDQFFTGFWGTLQIEGHWDSIFGSASNRELVFRRGPWEDWPTDLPKFKDPEKSVPMMFSPYCATLFHEAVGHALEADYIEGSPLKFYNGERISHEDLSIVDRPDLPGYAGSMSHDDTGVPASLTALVHHGFLVGDLGPGMGAMRRASYRELPQVRATNFVIKAGSVDPETWLDDLDRCYYVSWIQSGNWNPGSASFKALTGPVFELKQGRVIRWRPWMTLQLGTLSFLKRIIGVGKDMHMDPAVHWCMKKNQSVPISMGSPSLLIAAERR